MLACAFMLKILPFLLLFCSLLLPAGERLSDSFDEDFSESRENELPLLGKLDLQPEEALFLAYSRRISNLRSLEDLPLARAQDVRILGQLRREDRRPRENAFWGTFQGRKAFFKKFDMTLAKRKKALFEEAKWFLLLNKLNLGGEFFGVYYDLQGNAYLALDFEQGEIHFHLKDLRTTIDTFQEVLRVVQVLKRAGIQSTPDLQFLIARDGRAVLVDLEDFSYEDVPTDPYSRVIERGLFIIENDLMNHARSWKDYFLGQVMLMRYKLLHRP